MPLTMNTPSRQKFRGEVQLRKGSADTPTWVTTSSSFLNSGGTRKTQRFRARHTLFYLYKTGYVSRMKNATLHDLITFTHRARWYYYLQFWVASGVTSNGSIRQSGRLESATFQRTLHTLLSTKPGTYTTWRNDVLPSSPFPSVPGWQLVLGRWYIRFPKVGNKAAASF